MNYAQFRQWVVDSVDELIAFGVPREDAEALMASVEFGGIEAEAKERNESQFLLDLKSVGTAKMAERKRCSFEAIRAKRRKIIRKRTHRQHLRDLP